MPGTPVCTNVDDVRLDVKAGTAADALAKSSCGQTGHDAVAPPPSPMDHLLQDLRSAFDAEKAAGFAIHNQQDPVSFKRLNERVQALLQSYSLTSGSDWHKYALFNDLHYVRNLVDANEDFELIVLCWKAGQVSRVHNHAASHCWLAVLDGRMQEVQYHRVEGAEGEQQPQQPEGAVYVEATKTTGMQVGDVGYINDHIALHTVGCPMGQEEVDGANAAAGCLDGWRLQGGVTLHLYSPPIRRVKIYEHNQVTERVPGFYSKGGVRV